MCENLEFIKEEKQITKNDLVKAKLLYCPEKWNTFCYIVETEDKKEIIYFSESAIGKPINKNINDIGYIYKQYIDRETYIHVWVDDI